MIASVTSTTAATPFPTFTLSDAVNVFVPGFLLLFSALGFRGCFFGFDLTTREQVVFWSRKDTDLLLY